MTTHIPDLKPTTAEVRRWDAIWNGARHTDRCMLMRDGRVTFPPDNHYGYARFTTYGSEETDFLAWSDADGAIHVVAESNPQYTGRVCVGMAEL